MIEAADQSANVETRETVLNLLAAQGIFSRRERSSLIDFIRRLHSIDRLDRVEELMALPASNITVDDITSAVLDFCSHNFKPDLFYRFLDSQHLLRLDGRPLWMQVSLFCVESFSLFQSFSENFGTFLVDRSLSDVAGW